MCPTSHSIDAPFVTRKDYSLINVQPDGFVSFLDGIDTRDDLHLPREEEFKELSNKIQKQFDDGKSLLITIISAMGIEKIVDVKEE
jgi:translation initiation factor 5A